MIIIPKYQFPDIMHPIISNLINSLDIRYNIINISNAQDHQHSQIRLCQQTCTLSVHRRWNWRHQCCCPSHQVRRPCFRNQHHRTFLISLLPARLDHGRCRHVGNHSYLSKNGWSDSRRSWSRKKSSEIDKPSDQLSCMWERRIDYLQQPDSGFRIKTQLLKSLRLARSFRQSWK